MLFRIKNGPTCRQQLSGISFGREIKYYFVCSFGGRGDWKHIGPEMLTRPTWHEAKAEAEARESDAEAKEIFRGWGQNVWGRGRGPVL